MAALPVRLSFPTYVQPEVMPEPGKAGVYTNQMHYIKKHMLDELHKKKFAVDFMQPVNTNDLQVPQYYKVIKCPMDLGTITKRVENNYYRDVDELAEDFKQIISNCYEFNGPDSLVHRKGVLLEKFFLRTMKNLPAGPPVPCKKDPMATCKAKTDPMPQTEKQQCREQLMRLKTITDKADSCARNFFKTKWDSISKRLDKHIFKSLEDFRSSVDGIFKKYHDPGKMIYEFAFNQPGGYIGEDDFTFPPTSDVAVPAGDSTPSAFLSDADVSELLLAVQSTENGLKQCLKLPHRNQDLVETFCATVAQFKMKLEDIKATVIEPERVDKSAKFCLNGKSLDLILDVADAGVDDDVPPVRPFNQDELSRIQKQFGSLPKQEMRQILALVYSNETLSNNSGNLSYDISNFQPANVQMLDMAVTKAMKPNSKVNLRIMSPETQKDYRFGLESQLVEIKERLSQAPRKNAASLTNDGHLKRGRKRDMSRAPPQNEQTSLGSPSQPDPGNYSKGFHGVAFPRASKQRDLSCDPRALFGENYAMCSQEPNGCGLEPGKPEAYGTSVQGPEKHNIEPYLKQAKMDLNQNTPVRARKNLSASSSSSSSSDSSSDSSNNGSGNSGSGNSGSGNSGSGSGNSGSDSSSSGSPSPKSKKKKR